MLLAHDKATPQGLGDYKQTFKLTVCIVLEMMTAFGRSMSLLDSFDTSSGSVITTMVVPNKLHL